MYSECWEPLKYAEVGKVLMERGGVDWLGIITDKASFLMSMPVSEWVLEYEEPEATTSLSLDWW